MTTLRDVLRSVRVFCFLSINISVLFLFFISCSEWCICVGVFVCARLLAITCGCAVCPLLYIFFLVASHFFCSKPGYIPYPRPGYMPYPHAFDASSCRFLGCRGMAVFFFFFLTCLSPSFLLYYFLYIIALSFRIG